jgi:hypothetical protein
VLNGGSRAGRGLVDKETAVMALIKKAASGKKAV